MYKKILLATDGSEHSIRGVKSVIEICENKNCDVVIFHSIKHISDKISSVESSLNKTH
ncbi:MAG: universal stress protein, partial [Promethearchaeota archaeon]